jgi:mono/diheme cytochrome c family protein
MCLEDTPDYIFNQCQGHLGVETLGPESRLPPSALPGIMTSSCYPETAMPYHYVVILFLLLAAHVHAAPMELKLEQVRKDLGFAIRGITVIEPHEKCGERECLVTYLGVPLRTLLEYYYPKEWGGFEGEIQLIARDGYLGVVEASKVREKDAYLTIARADGKLFALDNNQQNERDVPLGPFYLVWDNREDSELQKLGAYGWPYQVNRIQLVSDARYSRLIPAGASASAQAGFTAFRTYCLTCHNLQGVGGRKVDTDMRLLITGKSRDELRAWISDPRTIRATTTMPPLNRNLDDKERARVIDQIVDFLEAR